VFKVRGFQVSADELEVLIRNHPDVDEVCVLGVPDPYSGEVPVALVVLGDEAEERAEKDQKEAQRIRISILKARPTTLPRPCETIKLTCHIFFFSSSRTTSQATSGLVEAFTSKDRSPSLRMGK
jgi:acyl-CoA synthetase (AMP-forming)/AMP-acid ligase II